MSRALPKFTTLADIPIDSEHFGDMFTKENYNTKISNKIESLWEQYGPTLMNDWIRHKTSQSPKEKYYE